MSHNPVFAGNWFIFSYRFINKHSKYNSKGDISATQLRTIKPTNIKNWNKKKPKMKWVKQKNKTNTNIYHFENYIQMQKLNYILNIVSTTIN